MSASKRWVIATSILLGLCALAGLADVGVMIWTECREAGHSALYCMKMVTR